MTPDQHADRAEQLLGEWEREREVSSRIDENMARLRAAQVHATLSLRQLTVPVQR